MRIGLLVVFMLIAVLACAEENLMAHSRFDDGADDLVSDSSGYQFLLGFHALGESGDERARDAVGTFDRLSEWQSVLDRIDAIVFPWDCTATLGKENPDALKKIMGITNSHGLALWADGRPREDRMDHRRQLLPQGPAAQQIL